MNSLHFLYGKPLSKGDMRTSNSDFQVQEILPFLPRARVSTICCIFVKMA